MGRRFETNVRFALPHLHHDADFRQVRHDVVGLSAGKGNHLPLTGEQGHFPVLDFVQLAKTHRHERDRRGSQHRRRVFGFVEKAAHAFVEGGSSQLQRVFHRIVDLHVEPAVDIAIQKLHRIEIDDGRRSQRQQAEQKDHAGGQV